MALGDGKEAVKLETVSKPGLLGMIVDEVHAVEQRVANAATATEELVISEVGKIEEMVTVSPVAVAVVAGIKKRYEFWKAKMADATEESMVESATEALGRIEQEAKNLGLSIKDVLTGSGNGSTTTAAGTESKKKGGKAPAKQPRSVTEKNQAATIKAAKLAEQAAGKPAGEAKAAAPKKEKVLRLCLDGCGAMVGGNFQMGHDAKLKSLLLKIERGEESMDKVPEVSAGIIKFKKGEQETLKDAKGTTTGTVQHYILLAAPVKFHGRPEVQVTQREA